MGNKDQLSKLSTLTVVLHWVVGVAVIVMLIVGMVMHEFDLDNLVPTHKSVGQLLFLVVIVRVYWRVVNGWPAPVAQYSKVEIGLAKVVHWVLLLGTLLMPISGMMMAVGGGHGLAIFGWELLAANPSLADPTKMVALNKTVAGIGHEVHGILAWVMIVAVVLHIAGALKHHVVDKDDTLRRILAYRK